VSNAWICVPLRVYQGHRVTSWCSDYGHDHVAARRMLSGRPYGHNISATMVFSERQRCAILDSGHEGYCHPNPSACGLLTIEAPISNPDSCQHYHHHSCHLGALIFHQLWIIGRICVIVNLSIGGPYASYFIVCSLLLWRRP
jgi:hypothetical protein